MPRLLSTAPSVLAVLAFLLAVTEMLYGGWLVESELDDVDVRRDVYQVADASRLYTGGRRVVYTRDSRGLRGEYAHPGAIDILAIGGGTTDERWVTDGETWLDVLRRAFAAAGRPQIIVNAAAAGRSSFGHIEAFRRWLPRIEGLRARYVLAYIGIDDVMLTQPRTHDDLRARAQQDTVRRSLASQSALVRLFRAAWNTIGDPPVEARLADGADPPIGEWHPISTSPDLEQAGKAQAAALAAYRERLARLVHLIRGFGAEPILVTQARGDYRIRDGRLYGFRTPEGAISLGGYVGIALVNRATLRACADLKITCIDLAGAISFINGDFYDAVHTTPRGSRRVGETLFPLLAPHIKDRPDNLPRPDGG